MLLSVMTAVAPCSFQPRKSAVPPIEESRGCSARPTNRMADVDKQAFENQIRHCDT
jgi:hypothetical protein